MFIVALGKITRIVWLCESFLMVWGGIFGSRKTCLCVLNRILNAQRYINEVHTPYVIIFLQKTAQILIFQQDNAEPHVVRAVTNFQNQSNVVFYLGRPRPETFHPLNFCGMICHVQFMVETNRSTMLRNWDKLWYGNGTIYLILLCSNM